jgi:hypothetical protein
METHAMGTAKEKNFKGGEIRAVNSSEGVIKVSTGYGISTVKGVEQATGTVFSLKINADTTITVNRLYRGLGDLGKGQTLKSVYYYDGSGTVVATVVHAIDKELLKKQQAEQKKGSEGGDGQAKPAI